MKGHDPSSKEKHIYFLHFSPMPLPPRQDILQRYLVSLVAAARLSGPGRSAVLEDWRSQLRALQDPVRAAHQTPNAQKCLLLLAVQKSKRPDSFRNVF